MYRLALSFALVFLSSLLLHAGDDAKALDSTCIDVGKKLAAVPKFVEANVKPFVALPDNVRKHFFRLYTEIPFSDDNRFVFCYHVIKKDADDDVRAGAASWLAKLTTNKLATKTVTDLLADKSPAVRKAACLAAGFHKDPTLGAKIAKLLADETPEVRLAAVKSLGQVNDRKLTPLVLASYKKNKKETDEDAPYAETLALLGETDVSLEIARVCMKSRQYPARLAGLTAIQCNPSMKVIPVLMENLVLELRRTITLDSTKADWDMIYATLCGELIRRTGKNYGHDAVGWFDWWETVRAEYMAPAPVFERGIVTGWMEKYRKMGPSKLKE